VSKRIKQLQSIGEYILFIGLISIFRMMPRQLSVKLLVCLFDVIGYRVGVRKQVAAAQLSKVYPEKSDQEIGQIIRNMYRNMALSIQEIYLDNDRILLSRCILDGREHIEAALAMGRGAILATGHFGNWEAARIMPLWGIPISVIAKQQRNRFFDRYTNRIRERNGACIIDMKSGLRGIIEHLQKNEMVAILTDQNAGRHGLITDFLGFPASHWKGAAKIALRYNVPIVPGFVIRDERDQLIFRFEPMIMPDKPTNLAYSAQSSSEDECLHLIRRINYILEGYITQFPHLWFWVHKRWKHGFNMFAK